ncbi:MAG TPA: glycosyltransferase [Longimicrobiales bacterium]|nr:glycosyltransferase [Longimicrobiales bacterium]
MSATRADVLYVTYDGLLEPLGASQVLPYVRYLSRKGVSLEILSFEKPEADRGERRVHLERSLAAEGIGWTGLRYHRAPTLPATAWDVLVGRKEVGRWATALRRQGRRGLVHARGYLPGLMGMAGKARGAKLLFDMRGFWVDERIQGGYWAPDGINARIGRWVERRVLRGADHLIVLTRKSIQRLEALTGASPPPHAVVPTCVDLDRFVPAADPGALREHLGIGAGPVLMHVGTLSGWYDGRATLEIARAFVDRTGGSFVVLSRDGDEVRRLSAEVGLDPVVRFVQPEEVHRWLQAADAGLALPRPSPSEDARFPTKIGEYLACGLAVLATPIGDLPDLSDPRCLRLLGPGTDRSEDVGWLARIVTDPARPVAARALAEARLGVAEGGDTLLGVYASLGVGRRGAGEHLP